MFDVLSSKDFSFLEVPGAKTAYPIASGRGRRRQCDDGPPPHGIARRPRTVRSNIVRDGMRLATHWEYLPQVSLNAWLYDYSPYVSEVTAGKFRHITIGSVSSLDYLFLIFRLMSQDCSNDLERTELIFLEFGAPIVSAHNLLASTAMTLRIRRESYDHGYARERLHKQSGSKRKRKLAVFEVHSRQSIARSRQPSPT